MNVFNKQWFSELQREFVDEFMYGDMSNWRSRRHPFVLFRHLFRQTLYGTAINSVSQMADLEGVDRATVTNSLNQEDVDVHPVLIDRMQEFILERVNRDPFTRVKLRLMSEGEPNEKLAQRYGVHVTVIDKIMRSEPVAQNTIHYIYQQCYTPQRNNHFYTVS